MGNDKNQEQIKKEIRDYALLQCAKKDDAILKLTNIFSYKSRGYKNLDTIDINFDKAVFKKDEINDCLANKYGCFSNYSIVPSYKENKNVKNKKDIVGIYDFLSEEKLILELEELLKIFYFYENPPLNITDEIELHYYRVSSSERQLDMMRTFYHCYVKPNYEKYYKNIMTREQHLAKIAHNFNMWEKSVDIEYEDFPNFLNNLIDIPIDIPIWMSVNIIGQKQLYTEYEEPHNERIPPEIYNETLKELMYNMEAIEWDKNKHTPEKDRLKSRV